MWFGEPWPSESMRAEVCSSEDQRVQVPTHKSCLYCDEPIAEGDRGMVMPAVKTKDRQTYETTLEAAHAECFIRMTVGSLRHLNRTCTCYGGDDSRPDGMSPREEAREVFEAVLRGTL